MTLTRHIVRDTTPELVRDLGALRESAPSAPVVADQPFDYGALTKAGAGGFVVSNTGDMLDSASIDSGDASNHFDINIVNGEAVITPTAGGDTADLASGPYSLGCTFTNAEGSDTATITVTTSGNDANGNDLANSFSVSDDELQDIIDLGHGPIDGKIILGRPSADIGGASIGDEVTTPTTLVLSTGLNIANHDNANPCSIRRFTLRHAGDIELDQILVRDFFDLPNDVYDSSSIIRFKNNASGRSGLTLTNCEGHSNTVADLDLSLLASGSAAAHTGGVSSTTVTLTNSPDLSAIPTDRSATILLGSSLRVITGVDDGANTVTIESAINIAEGSAVDYNIGYTPQTLRLIGQDGGLTNNPDLTIDGGNLHDYSRGLTGTYNSLSVINKTAFDNAYTDHGTIGVIGNETLLEFKNARFLRMHGRSTDPIEGHPDGLQVDCQSMTQDNSTPYVFEGLVFFPGNGRSHNGQGSFLEGIPSDRRVLYRREHCAYIGTARNAMVAERPAAGSVDRGHTLLFDQTDIFDVEGGNTPFISTISSTFPTGDLSSVLVEYCAASSISFSAATLTNNHLFGGGESENENADYAALFTGSDFDSDNMADADAFLAAATPDGNTTLWPANKVKIGALGGYYDYDTGVSDAPWDETGFDADTDWGNDTDVAVSTAVTSDKLTVTGVSSTGTRIRVSGGGSPTITLYDTDGTTVLLSAVTECVALLNQRVEIHDTSSGSGGVTLNVTVEAGSTSGTWSHTTLTAELITEPEFEATTDWSFLDQSTSGDGELVTGTPGHCRIVRDGGGSDILTAANNPNTTFPIGDYDIAVNVSVVHSTGGARRFAVIQEQGFATKATFDLAGGAIEYTASFSITTASKLRFNHIDSGNDIEINRVNLTAS